MKVLSLAVLCYWMIVASSESTESSKESLSSRASAQLERLAPYRRTFTGQKTPDGRWQSLDNSFNDYTSRILNEQRTAFEIYKLLPENLQDDIAKRIGANRATIELLGDPKYMAMMQDRIKRSGLKRDVEEHEEYASPPDGYHPYGGYGGQPESSGSDSGAILKGSGSLISGIASGIVSGIVSASSSASKGSSSVSASSSSAGSSSSSDSANSNKNPEYGQTYSYEDKEFGVWDFKKVIMSTLMQAVKAISGGVIALKGQILKGSGYLVSAKGRVITKTGDVITSLGRNIAKSAAYPSHHEQAHPGYSHDVSPYGGPDETYDGPPPSIEEYAEQNHQYHESLHDESPSDVDDQAGLLIMKPTKPDGHDHHLDTDSQKPQPEDSYQGPPPGLPEKHVENSLTVNADYQDQINHNQVTELDHPPSSYEVSFHAHQLDDHTKGQAYPIYPPLTSGLPANLQGPFSIQQSVEYPPIHIQYAIPNKGSFDLPNADTSGNDLSVYSSFSIDVDPKVKISTLKPGNSFELSKLQSDANLQSLPVLPSYSSLQGPLKIPLLNPLSVPYWPNQGLVQPIGNIDVHGWYRRRNSVQRRRSISDVAQRMRLYRG